MSTIKALIKRQPLLIYFALVFALSWGGGLVLARWDDHHRARWKIISISAR